jgi:LEA14-like dessication related protein
MKNAFWLLLGGGILWFYTRKVVAGKRLLFNIVGVDVSTKKQGVQVELINPTNTPIQFSSFVGSIIINGNSAGTIDYRQPIVIPANGRQVIFVPIRLSLVGAGGLIFDLIKGKLKQKLRMDIVGTINAEGFLINVAEVYEYGN